MFLICFLKVDDSIWNFLQGINWLYPTITSLNTFSKYSYPKNKHLDKSSLWIYKRYIMYNNV